MAVSTGRWLKNASLHLVAPQWNLRMAQLPNETKPKSSGTARLIEIDSQQTQYATDSAETHPVDLSGFMNQFNELGEKAESELQVATSPKSEVTCQENNFQEKKYIFRFWNFAPVCLIELDLENCCCLIWLRKPPSRLTVTLYNFFLWGIASPTTARIQGCGWWRRRCRGGGD